MSNIHSQTLQHRHIEAPQVFETLIDALSRLPRTLFATLGPRLLKDMGISEAEATREAAIPFWRVR